MQLLHNRYFEVLVDHKAIKYMIKSKTETPTTRLKTLLLKLSEFTINLKYQKGSEMHMSDTLSCSHNLTDNKDVILLIFSNILHQIILNMHILSGYRIFMYIRQRTQTLPNLRGKEVGHPNLNLR